jgi:Tol biopolymer transport system component
LKLKKSGGWQILDSNGKNPYRNRMFRFMQNKAFALMIIFIVCAATTSCGLGWGDDLSDKSDEDVSFAGDIERVSVASNGSQANGNSEEPSISSDGRIIAFISDATNLVTGDTNGVADVFVHDIDIGITERVNESSAGIQGNNDAFTLSLSSNGRFVAFGSLATNLVAGDTNAVIDVFVHDRNTGTTERVSISTAGAQANKESFSPAVSSDGLFIAFQSDATNLVPFDTNANSDIFVHDRTAGVTERVSVASDGTQGNGDSIFAAISSNGRFVAFTSEATNLVAGDTNNKADIFVHDRQKDTTERIAEPAEFNTGSGIIIVAPAISPDGGFLGFRSNADDLVPGDTNNSFDTFLIECDTLMAERASVSSSEVEGNADSDRPSISSNNRYVVFPSIATNLVSQDTNGSEDIFVRDRDEGRTRRVSLAFDGSESDNSSFSAVISGDGRFVAFTSFAENLVPADTNGFLDIFVIPNPFNP